MNAPPRATVVYHGTRISEEKIRSEGLEARTHLEYLESVNEALNHYHIPLTKAMRNPISRYNLHMIRERGNWIINQIWVTTFRENACVFAKNSPEKLTAILEPLIGKQETMRYLSIKYGKPKVVTLLPPEEKEILQGELNVPIGPTVPPERVLNIEFC